jgi:hypothetical protein
VAEGCLSLSDTDLDGQKALDFLGWYGFIDAKEEPGLVDQEGSVPKDALFSVLIDEEFCEHVQIYLDAIREARNQLVGAEHFSEKKVDLSWIVPGMSGTADAVSVEPLGVALGVDLKFGRGVVVEVGEKAGDNVQLSIYALGIIGKGNPNGIETVKIMIVQPRAYHNDGPVRSIEYDVQELLNWGEKVLRPAGEKATRPGAVLNAGSWCRWCDAEAVCPKLRQSNLESMFGDVEEKDILDLKVETSSPVDFETEKLAQLYALKPRITNWLTAVEDELLERTKLSGPDHGVKVVQGYGRRTWNDVVATVKALKKKFKKLPSGPMWQPSKLLTPPQMEKYVKKETGLKVKEVKEIINELTFTPTTGLKLVDMGDKRPAVQTVNEMFEKGGK